ncbi:cytochrome P450 [Allokutzneria sp. A3M-2-11 16]|uniref:cytochrome P450 family protein n=1 Tax=Allokutzneria sp. A3M-2-11 16 TaxID=2962043 RepID=UPI0020B67511|nr:cytochrome P450 [Allokutzneria sp. A3M-2-11 16]MCP3803361.1 cytochrome P450 [Allokutzneria sp. A3M-2-11 16]
METTEENKAAFPDPYPDFAWMRESMPVARLHTATGPVWLVTSFRHCRALLTDPRLSNDAHVHGTSAKTYGGMLDSDPPRHDRLRRTVTAAFTPRAVENMRGLVTAICEEAVDSFADKGSCELLRDYATPIPIGVIMATLGVPDAERLDNQHMVRLFTLASEQAGNPAAVAEADGFVERIVAYKRANPGDDVITTLLAALDRGELVDPREVVGIVSLLMGAGHTTTMSLITSACLRLLQHPEVRALSLGEPAQRRAVVEEALRYDGTVQASVDRFAVEEIEIAGVTIARGDRVVLSLAAANRDPERFAEPDLFDPDPGKPSNIGFGHGLHVCLGAHLARLEGEIALEVLFRRLPTLRLDIPAEDVLWDLEGELRMPRAVPVRFDPVA